MGFEEKTILIEAAPFSISGFMWPFIPSARHLSPASCIYQDVFLASSSSAAPAHFYLLVCLQLYVSIVNLEKKLHIFHKDDKFGTIILHEIHNITWEEKEKIHQSPIYKIGGVERNRINFDNYQIQERSSWFVREETLKIKA